jgi:hypothetical protein
LANNQQKVWDTGNEIGKNILLIFPFDVIWKQSFPQQFLSCNEHAAPFLSEETPLKLSI